MKKLLFAFAIVSTAVASIAAPRSISEIMKTPVKDLTPEEQAIRTEHMKATTLRLFGEDIVRPGSQKGEIAFVNAQTKLPAAEIAAVTDLLVKATKLKFVQVTEPAPKCSLERAAAIGKEANDRVAILIVADDKAPAMLVAPEERWAIVNVAKLGEGLPAGALYDKMFAGRCRKEIVRAFSLLCGGGSSQFAGNMFDAATVQDLDAVQEFLPIDMEQRYAGYLAKLGIRPAYICNYKQACQEGWAPAPTNDNQKAIWKKVHELPTEPLKLQK